MEIFHNNCNIRDRSYSRDSVQYASESSSSTSGQNRGRADTGDSSLSSDTNASTLSMGPRRRSHRPRGCRGGRKNRKKKNKVPDEIVGPTSSTSVTTTTTTTTHKDINTPQSSCTQPGMRQSPNPNQRDHNALNPSSLIQFPPMHPSGFQKQQPQNSGGFHPNGSQSSTQQQRMPPSLSNNFAVL
eukprot:scaffold44840_cov176-Amphora_coffeaeformis.AAC.3